MNTIQYHHIHDIIIRTAQTLPTSAPPLTSVLSYQEAAVSIVRIPLTRGKVAIIDAEDWPLVARYKWHAIPSRDKRTWYAHANTRNENGKPIMIAMHRLIAAAPKGIKVDHANHDGLDNRRENLRPCTNAQNSRNLARRKRNNTSGYTGVYWMPKRKRWFAKVFDNGKVFHLGSFLTAEDAARARDAAARELYGEFALLNFPDGQEPT